MRHTTTNAATSLALLVMLAFVVGGCPGVGSLVGGTFAVPTWTGDDQSDSDSNAAEATDNSDNGGNSDNDADNDNDNTDDQAGDNDADTGSLPENNPIVITPDILLDNRNDNAVSSNPPSNPTFTIDQPYFISRIVTVHDNGGAGEVPGTIWLVSNIGQTYGPWSAAGPDGDEDSPSTTWTVSPSAEVLAGTYTVHTSSPETWSYNAGSDNAGFALVEGFEVDQTDPAGYGTLSGTVVDALSGGVLTGVLVQVSGSAITATTNAAGLFEMYDVPAGRRTLSLSLDGYISSFSRVDIPVDDTVDVSVGMLEQGAASDYIAVMLTWGTDEDVHPRDLDLHVSGPDGSGDRFHVYYAHRTEDQAWLDLDDVTWGGPETITVRPVSGETFTAGEYHFWVHNYSHTPEFNGSEAVVTLLAGGAQLAQYIVDDAHGDPDEDIWQVFEITINEEGGIENINVRQGFTSGNSGTEF